MASTIALRRLASRLAGRYRAFSASAAEPAAAAAEAPVVSDAHRGPLGAIEVPNRLLMGPGPANAPPRVLMAQALPLLGHMHPPFLKIMDEIVGGLQYAFQTDSPYCLMVSGTGHAGMEASIANLVEPGETVVVGNKGIWGQRVCDLAARYGANVVNLETTAGKSLSYSEIKAAVETHKPALLFLCQGESSTGVHQSMAGLGDLCRSNGTLLLVDTVCSLGGVPMFADAWGIDAIYSGSQKALCGPPGGAPFYMGERAMAKLQSRKTPVASYYFDMKLVGDYWGWYNSRSYHHTGMVSTWYAMREALAVVAEEGLPSMWARHEACYHQLWDGLRSMGLQPFVENEADRLITINTIKVPDGVDWAAILKNAMDKYNVEIAGGLGPTMGKVWRVGLLGANATPANVELVLAAFRDGLKQQGKL